MSTNTLPRFDWSDSLKVGVPMIDTQHRELFAAVNDLADAIEAGQGGNKVKKLLTFLQFYAEWHFDNEEQCAAQHVCPIASQNKAAHTQFLQAVKELRQRYRETEGTEEIAILIHKTLGDWLINHILKIDTEIGKCIQEAKQK
ncbi:MAG: hemerythrin family protein [Pseudanabaena sp. ELA607]